VIVIVIVIEVILGALCQRRERARDPSSDFLWWIVMMMVTMVMVIVSVMVMIMRVSPL
jgi:hypothetical protein